MAPPGLVTGKMRTEADIMATDSDSPDQMLTVPDEVKGSAAWIRLLDQLTWYDRKSGSCQQKYKILRGIQVGLAVSIPVASSLPDPYSRWITAVSGAVIALLEAVQHMNQYSALWLAYRSTAENLRHEKYLFLSAAGQYKDLELAERLILLAEQVEGHVSVEHAKWVRERAKASSQSRNARG
jgi:hypothetical protein